MFSVCVLVVMICQAACDHRRPCSSFLTNSFFSCKDRALERDRPYQREKKISAPSCSCRSSDSDPSRTRRSVSTPDGDGRDPSPASCPLLHTSSNRRPITPNQSRRLVVMEVDPTFHYVRFQLSICHMAVSLLAGIVSRYL